MTLEAVDPKAPRVQCSARAKSTGRQCTKKAIPGGTVCRNHGGRAPQTANAASRRLALGEAIAELDRLGRPHQIDPAEAMLEMVYEAAGNVAVLRRLVQQLEMQVDDHPGGLVDDFADDPDLESQSLRAMGHGIAGRMDPTNWKTAPHVWVTMYDAERERLVRWAKACRDAGVDERRVQLAEDRGAQIAQVLTVAAGMLFELLASTGIDAGVLEKLRTEQLPGVFRKAITTTLAGEG